MNILNCSKIWMFPPEKQKILLKYHKLWNTPLDRDKLLKNFTKEGVKLNVFLYC